MKHKHADLIHAWAEGAQIQYKDEADIWKDIDSPAWHEWMEYRIKHYTNPQTKEWVVLTEDDLRKIILAATGVAEATLKERNK